MSEKAPRITFRYSIATVLCLLLIGAFAGDAKADDPIDFFSFLSILDTPQCLLRGYSCVPLGCGWLPPLDLVCHNYPAAFVETVKVPFTTAVPFLSWVMDALAASADTGVGGGGSSSSGGDNTHMKFFEAHVFDVPTMPFIMLQYPLLRLCDWPSPPFEVNYISEADVANWRTGGTDFFTYDALLGGIAQISQACTLNSVTDTAGNLTGVPMNIPGLGMLNDVCMGTWGVTYPRTGFSNALSEPVGSAIAAYRASRVVAKPFARVVFTPKPLLSANTLMQLGKPGPGFPLNCFTKGTTPSLWDNLTTTNKIPGNTGYIWVLWDRTCCCLPSTACL